MYCESPHPAPTPRASVSAAAPRAGRKYRHGRGTYHHQGDTYTGDWVQDAMEGAGVMVYSSGAKYDGQWKANCYSGAGRYHWPDGAEYDGDWQEGRMHGQGTLTLPEGQRWTGTWVEDRFLNDSGQWSAPPVPLHFV